MEILDAMTVRPIALTHLETPETTVEILTVLIHSETHGITKVIHGVLTHSATPEIIVVTVVVQIRSGTSVVDSQLDFNPVIV